MAKYRCYVEHILGKEFVIEADSEQLAHEKLIKMRDEDPDELPTATESVELNVGVIGLDDD